MSLSPSLPPSKHWLVKEAEILHGPYSHQEFLELLEVFEQESADGPLAEKELSFCLGDYFWIYWHEKEMIKKFLKISKELDDSHLSV